MELSTRRLRYLIDTEELIRNHGVVLILGIIFSSSSSFVFLLWISICLNAIDFALCLVDHEYDSSDASLYINQV